MLTSSESSGNEVIALLADTPPVGTDQGLTPKGPTELLRALVDASAGTETRKFYEFLTQVLLYLNYLALYFLGKAKICTPWPFS